VLLAEAVAVRYPSMSTRGTRLAFVFAVVIAGLLPKHVDCAFPGNTCARIVDHRECRDYEVEPFGFYLLELVFRRDIGFAYESGDDCR